MKKFVSLFLSLVMLFSITAGIDLSVYAEEYFGTCGKSIAWVLDKETGNLTISGNGDMYNFSYGEAPWYEYKEKVKTVNIANGITRIGAFAFEDCCNLINAVIPDSVISIEENAFWHCKKLADLKIPYGVVNIGIGAFYDCEGLTDIIIPESVISIGSFSFWHCIGLEKIIIPDSVVNIDESAFENCVGLTEVIISNGVITIGNCAFDNCKKLTEIIIPASVEQIEDTSFMGCSSLKNIIVSEDNKCYSSQDGVLFNKDKTILICYPTGNERVSYDIPDSVINIGDYSFYYCKKLAEIKIPYGVVEIGVDAFHGCECLTDIIIPDSVISIGVCAFASCLKLTGLIIPQNVIRIEKGTFAFCYNLTDIQIPKSVTLIGEEAFSICEKLTDVYYNGTIEDWSNIEIGESNEDLLNAKIHCIDGIINCNHTVVVDKAVEPTCTSTGLTEGSHCSVCNTVLTEQKVIDKKPHTVVIDKAVESTCTSTGLTEGSHCSVCNQILVKQEIIPEIPHNCEWINDNGHIVKKCAVCNDELLILPFIDLVNINYNQYADYIEYTSVKNQFITGTNPPANTVFSPTRAINRAMMVTILYRMAGEPYANGKNPYTSSPFTDITNPNVYYYDSACWALKNGITTETTFKPFDDVTREQTASFLFRYAQDNGKLGNSAYKNVNLSTYPDYSDVRNWAVEPLQWANYNGMITGTQQGYINPQGATQRIHATKILYGFGKVCNIGNFA